eukprot:Gregarina_sp_Poly_1__10453@NODE_75_length_15886_cov_79_326569_g64_i0_p2_GENE_NODE_75_length_15886_cov_79_326569_g64_i0NODE_75_length_15886_cov_79_326569_g64_i0_p2_ORF_typecomplete_len458_score57_69Peptidase_M18/PF02127_15/2_6e131Peptidase_M42/PF05343_14/1_2e07_NODE_75_length_15886_cov_79_326569_g64_i01313814511
MRGAEFVQFLNSCGSSYHAVDAVVGQILARAEAFRDGQRTQTPAAATGGYFRKDGALIAWRAHPELYLAQEAKFVILASHTDSPCLRLRPHCKLEAENCDLLGVETYGGGLWRTWFDRGLGVAGKVVFEDSEGKLRSKHVRIARPLAYIPSLCIHLETADERAAFKCNKEDQLRPIIGIKKEVESHGDSTCVDLNNCQKDLPSCSQQSLHFCPRLLKSVAEELRVAETSIRAWDLCLFDSQPAQLGGIDCEFVDGPGLDNRSSLFCNFKSLAEMTSVRADTVYIAVGFDHEEVGSGTTLGANSCLLEAWLRDIWKLQSSKSDFREVCRRSLLVSCDAAHAVHPNYAFKHLSTHKPLIGKGVTIKYNANQRYATTVYGDAFVRGLGVKYQEFEIRNDSGCGSTIGPLAASQTGIETLDVGIPIWSMHASREMAAVSDIESLVQLGALAYEKWEPECTE